VSSGELAPVCILAGGLGTRLGEAVRDTPKPLLEVAGRPFVLWQLDLLRSHGARRIVLSVGYLGEQVEAVVGDGRDLGLAIEYSYDPPGSPLGTAGAVRAALDHLGDEFHVLYGDTYLRIDYSDVQRAFEESGRPALMTVLHNRGRWDTSNAVFDGRQVTHYDKRSPSPGMTWIDYGLGVLTPPALDAAPEASDLADVYRVLAERGDLAGYEADERFYEIGTPDSLTETSTFLASLSSGRRRA
jgi:NDP-sugar pyrophosphorylase family protein